MAIYTSYFVATDEELERAFPGWKRPLAEPVRVKQFNRLTNQEVEVWSWDPGPDQPGTVVAGMEPYAVVEMEGDYAEYLDRRAHPLVRRSPHRCWKGVGVLEIEALRAVLTGETCDLEFRHFPPARISPPGFSGEIALLPAMLTEVLVGLGEPSVGVAEAWADACEDAFDPEYAAELLSGLRLLALQAERSRRNIYLLTEW